MIRVISVAELELKKYLEREMLMVKNLEKIWFVPQS